MLEYITSKKVNVEVFFTYGIPGENEELIKDTYEIRKEIVKKYGQRVGYTESEVVKFHEGGHRIRQVKRLSQVASLYSIEATVVHAKQREIGCQATVIRYYKTMNWNLRFR